MISAPMDFPMSIPFLKTTAPGLGCTHGHIPLLICLPRRPMPNHVTCGLRGVGRRGTLWRSDMPSLEAIQAVQSLKLVKSTPRMGQIMSEKISRLLKADLLNVLAELRRQNELDLALTVFKHIQNEVWYKPDLELYCDMIQLFGMNKMIEMAEALFSELRKFRLQPDTRAYTEMIGAYFKVGLIGKAMETYEMMKSEGCKPNRLTLTILIRNLESYGDEALAADVMRECALYMDFPQKFFVEVKRKYPKKKSLNLV
ncbi:hypothetical protein SAY87_004793 [Trapa incisa]|uniref:Pentatricopeptide repeat-containing protein n=1 Tax=Trapa incisa TaxID=236973 RepID=A0AAN7JPJ5_9MYRT|nr:hypothetical protein SAY87_004793 [Trapa incisa]